MVPRVVRQPPSPAGALGRFRVVSLILLLAESEGHDTQPVVNSELEPCMRPAGRLRNELHRTQVAVLARGQRRRLEPELDRPLRGQHAGGEADATAALLGGCDASPPEAPVGQAHGVRGHHGMLVAVEVLKKDRVGIRFLLRGDKSLGQELARKRGAHLGAPEQEIRLGTDLDYHTRQVPMGADHAVERHHPPLRRRLHRGIAKLRLWRGVLHINSQAHTAPALGLDSTRILGPGNHFDIALAQRDPFALAGAYTKGLLSAVDGKRYLPHAVGGWRDRPAAGHEGVCVKIRQRFVGATYVFQCGVCESLGPVGSLEVGIDEKIC